MNLPVLQASRGEAPKTLPLFRSHENDAILTLVSTVETSMGLYLALGFTKRRPL